MFYDIKGRWPVKSAKFLLGLLKNAQSNAEVNGLDAADLKVSFPFSIPPHLTVFILTTTRMMGNDKRSLPSSFNKLPRLEDVHTELMEELTLIKDILVTLNSFSLLRLFKFPKLQRLRLKSLFPFLRLFF